jgi:hypothetical protein
MHNVSRASGARLAIAALPLAIVGYASNAAAQSGAGARGSLLAVPSLQARGAQPLGAIQAVNGPTVATTAESSEQKSGAMGPGLFYFNTEGGFQSVDLHMLRADNFLPTTVESSGGGAFFGLGAGVRLAFLTLGGRFRTGEWSNWSLSTLDGELGAHISIGQFEPYFTFGAGYASMHTIEGTTAGDASLDVHGFDARAGVGVDYRPDRMLSFGLSFTGDLLALARPGVDLTASPQAQVDQVAARCNAIADPAGKQQCALDALHDAEGTSVGVSGSVSLVMGLHF